MTDYIEKNSVIELIDDAIRNCKWHVAECTINTDDRDLKTLREKVKAIPAADVAPVVHGRWRIIKEAPITRKIIPFNELTELDLQNKCRCSRCGFNCGIGVGQSYLANYCPQCGARMDGEYHG